MMIAEDKYVSIDYLLANNDADLTRNDIYAHLGVSYAIY